MASSFAEPTAVRLDPFRAHGRRLGQREVEDRKRLAVATPPADRDDLLVPVQADALYGDGNSEDNSLERDRQVVVDHREPACDLLRLVVAVDRRRLDHLLELALADARTAGILPRGLFSWHLGRVP